MNVSKEIDILFQRFLSEDCTEDEFNKLMSLLKDSQYEDIMRQKLYSVYQNIEDSNSSFIQYNQNNLYLKHTKGKTKKKIIALSVVAASILICVTIGTIFLKTKYNNKHTNYITKNTNINKGENVIVQHTKRGEQKELALEDGTHIWLNSESTLRIPLHFDKKQREIFLIGEAFFDVKHAKDWPFIIRTQNGMQTSVLGTAFDIKAYISQNMSVSVKRGRVKVSKQNVVLAILKIGEQIKIPYNSDSVYTHTTIVHQVKEDNIAGWKLGKLSYDAMTFEEILQDLERTYNVHIYLKNHVIANEIISITADKNNGIESLLRTLCTLTNTTFNYQGGDYNIY